MCSRKWLMVALVACGFATACQDYNTNLSVQTASSILTYISPASASVGGQGFTITANGQGFATGAEILWNGVPLVTTLVNSIQLTAPVPAADLTNTGVVQVAIEIPGSAQSPTQNTSTTVTTAVSDIVLFTVSAAPGTPPAITSLSPSSAPFCGNTSAFTLTLAGSGFTSDAMVNWNGSPRATSFDSTNPTQLKATILPADTSVPSPVAVTVSNSSGTSNALQFTIASPAANLVPPESIASLAPSSAFAGSSAVSLTVNGGSGAGAYLPCSVVKWVSSSNGTSSLPTQYVSATQLTATIPATDIQTAGTAQVVVFTPTPGGGTTSGATFTITQPPTPAISAVSVSGSSPPVTSCSTAGFTLQVTGTNFVTASLVNWNGSSRPTTFVSATQLTATIPYTDTVATGTATITVSNGSAVSNSLPFAVAAPPSLAAPTATSIAPTGAMAGSQQFTLTVTGTSFVPCSVIQWNGSPRTTTYINPTQLSVPIFPGDLASAGTVPVTVSTPPSGCTPSATVTCGGTSTATAATTFTISALSIGSLSASTTQMASTPYCGPAGFTLTVTAATGTTFTSDTVVSWNGSPRPTTFVSATQLSAAITYADTAFPGSVSVVVSNSASTSAAKSFALSTPASLPVPSINVLSPSNAAAKGPAFTLSVTGSGLLPCSAVQWNISGNISAPITTFTSVNGLTAAIPAMDILTAGMPQVTVNTPPPSGCTASTTPQIIMCGGPSNALAFTVYTPVAGAVRTAAAVQQEGDAGGGSGPGALLSLHLMSSGGRYAVHVLASTDGVEEIPGTTRNIFVRDTCAGAVPGCVPSEKLVSVGLGGNLADGDSFSPSISADGRYVAFLSSARNLVDSDTNGVADVFLRDTCAGAASGCAPSTQLVSVAGDGTQANGASVSATVGATGRYVTFESAATNLGAASVSSSGGRFFLRDTCAGAGAGCVPSTEPLD